MFDFAAARKFMVEGQIRASEVTNPPIVAAMSALERERFVPASLRTLAYAERDMPAAENGQPGADRFIPSPRAFAKLVGAAEIRSSEDVLLIGCTTGYGAAVLAKIANSVVAVEENDALAGIARENLTALDLGNAAVVTAPLIQGYPAQGPYDVILIEGAVEVVPGALAAQLKENGRLVAIVGAGRTGQGTVFRRTPQGLSGFPLFDAAAPVLPGFAKAPAFVF